MKINHNDPPNPVIKRKIDLTPNTLYVDKDGEVHITDLCGNLLAFFRNSGRIVSWRETSIDNDTFEDLQLTKFTGTISN